MIFSLTTTGLQDSQNFPIVRFIFLARKLSYQLKTYACALTYESECDITDLHHTPIIDITSLVAVFLLILTADTIVTIRNVICILLHMSCMPPYS